MPRVVLTTPDGQHEFSAARKRIVFGRGRACDVRLPHPSVSRWHCELRIRGRYLWARDLDSRHGTFVGQRRLGREPRIIAGPATIRCGEVVVELASSHGRGPREWVHQPVAWLALMLATALIWLIVTPSCEPVATAEPSVPVDEQLTGRRPISHALGVEPTPTTGLRREPPRGPTVRRTPALNQPPMPDELRKRPAPSRTSISVGAPNRGHLDDGTLLPESPDYIRRARFNSWGSAYAVHHLQEALHRFRRAVGDDVRLVVADMSRRGGGTFPPHKSHQSGRDVDIWLPTPAPSARRAGHLRKPNPSGVDWHATWILVRTLLRTGAVERVFLAWPLQERIYRAARAANASPEELAWIQWPRPAGSSEGKLRHCDDHVHHIHVRFLCAPWEYACTGIARPNDLHHATPAPTGRLSQREQQAPHGGHASHRTG